MGLLSAAGEGVGSVWEVYSQGSTRALQVLPDMQELGLKATLGARIQDFDARARLGRKFGRDIDRATGLAQVAAEEALVQAGLDQENPDPARSGILVGTGFGGVGTFVEWSQKAARDPSLSIFPLVIPMSTNNATSYHLGRRWGWDGPSRTYSTACSSSLLALLAGADLLALGRADRVLVVGMDSALVPYVYRAWQGLRVMSEVEAETGRYRPFADSRPGFVLGEAAAAVVLETEASARARGATCQGLFLGGGNNLDRAGITTPSEPRQIDCMRLALEDAGCEPSAIEFVAAHGSGTILNDAVEARAIAQVFGESEPWVADAKPVHGHTMGASGLAELVLALTSQARRHLPAIPDVDAPGGDCPVRLPPPSGAKLEGGPFLLNSFGFGGTNVSVVVGGSPSTPPPGKDCP